MMICGEWRYLRGDPPASRPFRTATVFATAIVFAAVWAVVAVMLLGALALRLLWSRSG
jgi:hypothetical protein